jgi:hypothetical protein
MIDPKLNEAFVKSIKHYFDDNEPTEYNKTHGSERKFSKKYFDTLDEQLNNPTPEDKKKVRKGKK